jgi:tRNA-specific 2-thiouridylase
MSQFLTSTMPIKTLVQSSVKKRVFVGLSGGVDSSVSALLLQNAGYEVTGVFIKVWQPENGDCTWKEDRRDAMRVAAHLGIKFITLDLREEYKRGVVDYMVAEYAKGRTPNPDVMCNREVKFGAFMNWAIAQGADFVATGHYAQTRDGEMFEGCDMDKDQSYFLWTLKEEQLRKILFPIGHLEKSEVRKIAEKSNIPVAKKKDSQGVCFIGHIDMKDFIREHVSLSAKSDNVAAKGLAEGNVLDINGDVIGKHDGSLLYTIGERHGLALNTNGTNTPRYYVIDKDVEKNTITVAEKEQIKNDGAGSVEKLIFNDIHFISKEYKELLKKNQINCLARARYRQKKEKCILSLNNEQRYEVVFAKPQEGITPGQSLVLYFDDESSVSKKTLGGVII